MNKLYVLFLLVIGCTISSYSQAVLFNKDSTWQFGGFVGVSASQAAYYQWVPGNQFALSINCNAAGFAKFKKGKWSWDNNLEAKYGMVALGRYKSVPDRRYPFKKSDDLLQINTQAGYAIGKKMEVSILVNFKTQFAGGYGYKLDSTGKEYSKTLTSKFAGPAFMKLGLGFTYKPTEYFTLFMSPVTGDLTIVDRSQVRISNVPVEDRYQRVNEVSYGLKQGSPVLAGVGAYVKANFQKDIVKNVNYKTQLELFYDYTFPLSLNDSAFGVDQTKKLSPDQLRKEARKQVDVDWQNDVVFKVNKYISATLFWRIKYRWREAVPVDKNKDGFQDTIENPDGSKSLVTRRGVQIAEVLGIGFAYKF